MISFPRCKINIGLNIHLKRDDGYHEISSVMYPVPMHDVLEIVRNDELVFSHSGLSIPGNSKDNLCVKAYELINQQYSITPVHAHLYKNIPMGGGLGGGSADATEMLKMLNEEFELMIDSSTLKELASKLGSDCPFFVEDQPQYATGRGELLSPIGIDLKGYYLLLINDGTHVSTQQAYAEVNPREPEEKLSNLINLPVEHWKDKITNQFEESVFKTYPHLADLKSMLYDHGAVYASMSGSGATMYGLFKSSPKLDDRITGSLTVNKLIEL